MHHIRTFIIGFLLWTSLLVCLLILENIDGFDLMRNTAIEVGRESYKKDIIYRKWAASHGGIYVPITNKTPSNPNLVNIPERDIQTPSGKLLTLVNPAYMTRQVNELQDSLFGRKEHLTSSKPVQEKNISDVWEKTALLSFEQGKKEYYSFDTIQNVEYLRYMGALMTEKNCLKCHETQGYKIGDVRGGLSVNIPWQPYNQVYLNQKKNHFLKYFLIWLVGTFGLWFSIYRISINLKKRIKAENALRENEQKLSNYIKFAPLGIFVADDKGNYIEVNPAASKITGFSEDELLSKNITDIIGSESIASGEEHFKMVVKDGFASGNFSFIRKNGSMGFWSVDAVKINEKRFLGFVVDITERKLSEEQLRESEEKFSKSFENAPAMISISKIETGEYIIINEEFERKTGFKKSELIGRTSIELGIITPEDRAHLLRLLSIAGSVSDLELTLTAKDNHKISCLYNAQTITIDGNPCLLSLAQDITERKTAQDALLVSQEQLKFALSATNDGIWDVNMETGSFFISERGCEILGYQADETSKIADQWHQIVHPDDLASTQMALNDYLDEKVPLFMIEQRLKSANGNWIWILTRGKAVDFDSNKKPLRMVGTHTDISIRKEAEDNLRKSELHLRTLVNTIPDLIWLKDTEGKYLQCNHRFEMFFGAKEEEITGKTDYDFVDKELADFFRKNDQIAMLAGKPTINEELVTFADNHEEFLETIKTPIFAGDGTMIGVLGIGRDITERKNADNLLRQEKQFSDMVIESLPGIFYMFDSNFTPVKWNHNKTILLGLTEEEMKTHNTIDFIVDRDKSKVIETFQKTFIEGEGDEIVHIIRHDGKEIAYQLTGKRLETLKGTMLIGVGIDVNERIKAQNELIIALERAEESDRLKTAFLQNMSHEIRTPLNGIIGFTRLLQDEELEKDDIKLFNGFIQQSSYRLMDIVNNILEISQIETGQISINKSSINIDLFLIDIYKFFVPLAETKNLTVIYKNKANTSECFIRTDKSKLTQIFNNLFNNALKFTQSGSIEFGYEIIENSIKFHVKDSGIGILPENHSKIFERFVQVDDSISRSYEGSGLGLAICKGIVELLGGRIWIESEIDNGSTFYFDLPYHSDVQAIIMDKEIAKIPSINKKIKILIAEDDDTSFFYLQKSFKGENYAIIRAENGEQAIDIVKNNDDIDIILMDIKMPEVDGNEAIKVIKTLRPDLPIIVQTAYAFNEEKTDIMELGCDEYLSKPVDFDKLMELIYRFLK